MATQPRDMRAERLAARLDRAAHIIPSIRTHLNEQRSHLITLSAAGGGNRTNGYADPTLRSVVELDRLGYLEGVIDDALASIEVGINLLDRECRTALGHRATVTNHTLCSGGNPSTFGDPECGRHIAYKLGDNHAVALDPDHLCDEHRIAKDAWDARAASAARQRKHRRGV